MATFLHGVEVIEITDGLRPIRAAATGVIGLVGTAPAGPIDTPTLIAGSRTEAAAFGSGVGTIPDALDAILTQTGAVVVVVNCLDPAVHRRPVAAALRDVRDGVAQLPDRYVQDVSAAVSVGGTAIPITEYTLDAAAGTLTRLSTATVWTESATQIAVGYERLQDEAAPVTGLQASRQPVDIGASTNTGAVTFRPAGRSGVAGVTVHNAAVDGMDITDQFTVSASAGTIARSSSGTPTASTVYVSYTYTETRGVPDSAIVGAVDAQTGAATGIQALLGAESALGRAPKILIAPGRSDRQTVATALVAAAERLRATAVIEGPSTTDSAAIDYRRNFGSRRAYVVDPGVKVAGAADGETVDRPVSPYVAGVIARTDSERGPWWSPSNQEILGILGTSREIDFVLGDASARANLLNEAEVATIIRQTGHRLWGNRTCSADAQWAFLSVVRTGDMIQDAIMRSHLWAVDRAITRTYLEDVAEGVTAYIAELVGLGALLGGACRPSPELNTQASIAAGRVYFDVDFTPPAPAERVTFRSRLTDDYIETIL